MGRIDKVCIVGMLALMAALSGCGKQEVVYDETSDVKEQEVNKTSSMSLRDMLGCGEETVWREDIEGANGTIKIMAPINIPDTESLYTVETEKYYVTAEDKKSLAEYFMDADTIKVDKESVTTREATGNSDEISGEPGDYSEDFYTGSRNGVDYAISFYADEGQNRSAWRLYSASEDRQWLDSLDAYHSNQCSMTAEEAQEKAVKLCEELGLPSMTPVIVNDLEWIDESLQYTTPGYTSEYNGYVVELARSVNGVATDITYYSDNGESGDGELTEIPYSTEQVIVVLTDDRIVEVFYKGILTDGKMGKPVKLLSLEQIKEIFRKELEKEEMEGVVRWEELTLTYMRVPDENNPNTFRYIPVWRLSQIYQNESMQQWPGGYILLNAMDGSRIDAEEIGLVQHVFLEGDYE